MLTRSYSLPDNKHFTAQPLHICHNHCKLNFLESLQIKKYLENTQCTVTRTKQRNKYVHSWLFIVYFYLSLQQEFQNFYHLKRAVVNCFNFCNWKKRFHWSWRWHYSTKFYKHFFISGYLLKISTLISLSSKWILELLVPPTVSSCDSGSLNLRIKIVAENQQCSFRQYNSIRIRITSQLCVIGDSYNYFHKCN